jgi:hypothetical protein
MRRLIGGLVALTMITGMTAAIAANPCCSTIAGTAPTGGGSCTNDTVKTDTYYGDATCTQWTGGTAAQYSDRQATGYYNCNATDYTYYWPKVPNSTTLPCDSSTNTCQNNSSGKYYLQLVTYTDTVTCPAG